MVFPPLSDSAQVIPRHCDLFALSLCPGLDFSFSEEILVGLRLWAPAGSERPSWGGGGFPASQLCPVHRPPAALPVPCPGRGAWDEPSGLTLRRKNTGTHPAVFQSKVTPLSKPPK